MASMKDIKRRKSSIQSTQQITKAMKLVSTVKLQKAKGRAEQTNPYFNYMYQTVSSMLAKSGNINHTIFKIRGFCEKGSGCDHVEPWTCRRLQLQYCKADYRK